jgi:hypothetical protein
MGRGRAKAKQTKVARELKYNSGGTDLNRLREELLGDSTADDEHDREAEADDEYVDPYADLYPDEDDDAAPGRSA